MTLPPPPRERSSPPGSSCSRSGKCLLDPRRKWHEETFNTKLTLPHLSYSPPTSFAPSLTHPIPTVAAPWLPIPLAHIYALTSRFVPYTLTIRRLHPSESPKQLDWSAMAETLAATARLKRVGALGWKEKAAFLEFRKLKGR